jgi:NAD(P)H dehydrogenase (quinone)
MHILIVLAHPNPKSFNHAIARTAAESLRGNNHTVVLHDLYAEGFNPALPDDEIMRLADLPPELRQQCDELASADGLIFVHPNWWGMPPAILKGWIDRVMRPDVAYRFLEGDSGEGIPQGLLKAQSALVFNTSNTSAKRELSIFGDPLDNLWKKCILNFCGIKHIQRRNFSILITSTSGQRALWLEDISRLVKETFPAVKPLGAKSPPLF